VEIVTGGRKRREFKGLSGHEPILEKGLLKLQKEKRRRKLTRERQNLPTRKKGTKREVTTMVTDKRLVEVSRTTDPRKGGQGERTQEKIHPGKTAEHTR